MNDKYSHEETKQLLDHAVSYFGSVSKVAEFLEVEAPRISEGRHHKWRLTKSLGEKILAKCGKPSANHGDYLLAVKLGAIEDLRPVAECYIRNDAMKKLNKSLDSILYNIEDNLLLRLKKRSAYNKEQLALGKALSDMFCINVVKVKDEDTKEYNEKQVVVGKEDLVDLLSSSKIKMWAEDTKAYFSDYITKLQEVTFKSFSSEHYIERDCRLRGIETPKQKIEQMFIDKGFDLKDTSSHLLLLIIKLFEVKEGKVSQAVEFKEYVMTGCVVFEIKGNLSGNEPCYLPRKEKDDGNCIFAGLMDDVVFGHSQAALYLVGDFLVEGIIESPSYYETNSSLLSFLDEKIYFLKTGRFDKINVRVYLKKDLSYAAHIALYGDLNEPQKGMAESTSKANFVVEHISAPDIFSFIKNIYTLLGKDIKDFDLTSIKEKIAAAGGYIPGAVIL